MSQDKQKLFILCGGQSAEHEVSIVSAKSIVRTLDQNKYQIYVVYIAKNGAWFLLDSLRQLLTIADMQAVDTSSGCQQVVLVTGEPSRFYGLASQKYFDVDIVFPVLHGPNGEDGTVQGLLELAKLPYVGCDVLSAAICMEKDVSKRLLQAAGLTVADWLTVTPETLQSIKPKDVINKLGLPLFVKPSNLGSSVGISKVSDEKSLMAALEFAFKYSTKVLVEQAIVGRELEVSVLGNSEPKASLPGELITQHDFYSYEAKYLDPNGAQFTVPAKIAKPLIAKIKEVAIKAYQANNCIGMTRVDCFVTEQDEIIVNELNPIPGFTKISLYPQNWEASGLPYAKLLDELISLAVARRKQLQHLQDV